MVTMSAHSSGPQLGSVEERCVPSVNISLAVFDAMPRYRRVIDAVGAGISTAPTETDRMWRRIDPVVHATVQQYHD